MLRFLSIFPVLCLSSAAAADVISLTSGGQLEGEITKEDAKEITLRTAAGVVTLARKDIAAIEKKPFAKGGPATGATGARGRLPEAKAVIQSLRGRSWAKSVKQVAAPVLAEGPARNVPYMSYRATEDYEINIYGDPAAPVAIEVGLHNMPARSDEAKKQARAFVGALLTTPEDRATLDALDMAKDSQVREGLTFEIRPAGDKDQDGVWWIWVYDDRTMDLERASAEELTVVSKFQWVGSGRQYRPPPPRGHPRETPPGGEPWTDEELAHLRRQPGARGPDPKVYIREYARKDGKYAPAHQASK